MKKVIISSAVLLISIFGCKKGNDIITPTSDIDFNDSHISGYFEDNFKRETQTFQVNSAGDVIFGKNGTTIGICPNSFQDASGNTVYREIIIELVEILDYKTMVKTQKTTTSNGEILVSGGQIYLAAFQNGKKLTTVKPVAVRIPTKTYDDNMKLFEGELNGSVLNWNSIDVTLSSTEKVKNIKGTNLKDSLLMIIGKLDNPYSQTEVYYEFNFSNPDLGWINCDYFYNYVAPRTSLEIDLGTGFNALNTKMYMVLPRTNSVMEIYGNENQFIHYDLPVGLEVVLVSVSEIGGQFYYGQRAFLINENHVQSIEMKPSTIEEIESNIDKI